jgi:hypothetical protein
MATIWFWALVAAGYVVPSLLTGRAMGTSGQGLKRWGRAASAG